MQIVEVAERFAKIVQGFGLGVQRLWARAGKKRELIAQIDHAGAKGMQRNRVVAAEAEAPAFAGLSVGASDCGADCLGSERAQLPSLTAAHDRVQPRSWRAAGEAAARALSRLSLTRDRGHERFGDLGRGFETLDANRHHVEVARPADLAARCSQRRDRHPSRLAYAIKKEPRDRTRFLQGFAHVVNPLRRLFAGAGKLRRGGTYGSNERRAAMLRPSVGTHQLGLLRLNHFSLLAQREFLHLAGRRLGDFGEHDIAWALIARQVRPAPLDKLLGGRAMPRFHLDEGAGRFAPFVVWTRDHGRELNTRMREQSVLDFDRGKVTT